MHVISNFLALNMVVLCIYNSREQPFQYDEWKLIERNAFVINTCG